MWKNLLISRSIFCLMSKICFFSYTPHRTWHLTAERWKDVICITTGDSPWASWQWSLWPLSFDWLLDTDEALELRAKPKVVRRAGREEKPGGRRPDWPGLSRRLLGTVSGALSPDLMCSPEHSLETVCVLMLAGHSVKEELHHLSCFYHIIFSVVCTNLKTVWYSAIKASIRNAN